MKRYPSNCQKCDFGANAFIAPKALEREARPITASDKKIGKDSNKEATIYTKTKAAPPYWPAIYGNLQMFPSPIADPANAIITANLPAKFSLTFSIKTIIIDARFARPHKKLSTN